MTRLLASAAALALMTSAVLAADLLPVEEAPILAPAPTIWDWSGFYSGGFVGYGFADVDVDENYNNDDFSYDTDGFYGGTLLGYNVQWNWALIGVEAELGYMKLEDDEQTPIFSDVAGRTGDSIASIDTDFFGNVSGRLGLVYDRFLIYGKGGVAFSDVEVQYEDPNPLGTTLIDGTSTDEWLFGWTAGGGVEVGVWENWTVRGEYMYTDLEEIEHTATNNFGTEFEFVHDLEDIHTVKLGVTRRF